MSKGKYLERTLQFHKIYSEEVRPILTAYEETRKRALFNFWTFLAFCILLCCSPFLGIFLLISPKFADCSSGLVTFIVVILCLPAVFGVLGLGQLGDMVKDFAVKLKTKCLGRVLEVFGDIKWFNNQGLINDYELDASALFASYNRRSIDDEFVGTYNGVGFKVCETSLLLERNSGKHKTVQQIFKGVVIEFDSNKTIKNRTMIATKGDLTKKSNFWMIMTSASYFIIKLILNYPTKIWAYCVILGFVVIAYLVSKYMIKEDEPLNDVKLEDPRFNKKFVAYSSDQIEARYLLTPSFIERFQNLKTAFGANKAKCSFFGDKIMFAISTDKNLFEVGSLFTPLTDSRSINDFYNELSSIYKMIDYFKLDEKTGL